MDGEASGKSLIAYHVLANCQKMGGLAVYIDTERAGTQEFMERMGIDWNKLYRPQIPDTIEQVFTLIEKIAISARTHVPDKSRPVVIVWDSIAATNAEGETETAFEDTPAMGMEARAMSRGLRKINKTLKDGYLTLICINQVRDKIGVMGFGDKETTPHGKSLPFYASVRIKLKSIGQIKNKQKEETLGVNTRAKVFKNKVGPNFREVDFPLYYDWGVNDEISLMEFLRDIGIIEGDTWNKFKLGNEEYKWQGTSKWSEIYNKPEVKKFVLDTVDKFMIKTFKERPEDIAIDMNSLMEVEQLKEDIKNK